MKNVLSLVVLALIVLAMQSCSNDDLVLASIADTEQAIVEENTNPNLLTINEARSALQEVLAQMKGVNTTRSSFDLQAYDITSEYSVDLPSLKATHGPIQDIQIISNKDTLKTVKIDPNIMERWQAMNRVYFFNFGDDEGYAVVSGDKNMPPLLMLTNKGTLTPNAAIENEILAMMTRVEKVYRDELIKDIMHMDEEVQVTTETTTEKHFYPNSDGSGLCVVTWNQGAPYNKYCPLVEGRYPWAGCVTTAVAQLMSIYKYPSSYLGYTFDWDEMTETAEPKTVTSINQVARLMELIGRPENLNIDYGLEGSYGYASDIPKTLRNFGYSDGGTFKDYDKSVISNELHNGRPVLVNGHALKSYKTFNYSVYPTYSSGHTWVLHGLCVVTKTKKYINVETGKAFKTESVNYDYVLCNFGWSGERNGYYLNGSYNTNLGPSFIVKNMGDGDIEDEDVEESILLESTGQPHNYQYNLHMVTGFGK